MVSVERRVLRLILAEKKSMLAGLFCTAGVVAITGAITVLIKFFVDLAAKHDLVGLDVLMIPVGAIAIPRFFVARGQMYYLAVAAQGMTAKLRKRIFEHLQSLPLSYFQVRQPGALQSAVTNDTAVVEGGMKLVRDVVGAPLMLVGGLAGIFYLNWRLALVAIFVMPLMLIVIVNRGRRVRRITAELQDRIGKFTSVLEESLRSVRVTKSFGMEDYEVERFQTENDKALRTSLYAQKKISTIKPLLELMGMVGIAAVLWLGGRDVANHRMSTGDLMGFLYLVQQMVQAAGNLGSMNATRAQVLAAADRIYREVLDVKSDILEKPNALPLPPVEGRIDFADVSFRYPDGTEALSHVTFTIYPGESVAIVGESGAGKSTMADLLLRFFDATSGAVQVDGYDVRDVTVKSLRAQIGVVPQTTMLFAASIRQNVKYGKPDATEDEVLAAIEAANLSHFVTGRNGSGDGLDDAAGALSGGERQRVAIARALVRKPAILVLDEATSSLDSVSERSVQEAVENNQHQRTLVLIAHRLSTAARADRILVLRNGRLVEHGSHSELLAREGEYARLYAAYTHGVVDAPAADSATLLAGQVAIDAPIVIDAPASVE